MILNFAAAIVLNSRATSLRQEVRHTIAATAEIGSLIDSDSHRELGREAALEPTISARSIRYIVLHTRFPLTLRQNVLEWWTLYHLRAVGISLLESAMFSERLEIRSGAFYVLHVSQRSSHLDDWAPRIAADCARFVETHGPRLDYMVLAVLRYCRTPLAAAPLGAIAMRNGAYTRRDAVDILFSIGAPAAIAEVRKIQESEAKEAADLDRRLESVARKQPKN